MKMNVLVMENLFYERRFSKVGHTCASRTLLTSRSTT